MSDLPPEDELFPRTHDVRAEVEIDLEALADRKMYDSLRKSGRPASDSRHVYLIDRGRHEMYRSVFGCEDCA